MPQLVTENLGRRDVLVVGGGIAGTAAALAAGEEGARTAVACARAPFGPAPRDLLLGKPPDLRAVQLVGRHQQGCAGNHER